MKANGQEPLLKVENLVKHFPITKGLLLAKQVGAVKAVDGISFTIDTGETLGLVGESGCGKSTTGRLVLGLIKATSGSVYFAGQDVFTLNSRQLRALRKDMQIIFQDPFSSLNPRMTIEDTLAEPLLIHNIVPKERIGDRVAKLLEDVGLDAAYKSRYPHEFSGGQRQRIGIARALAVEPKFIVCDEPVSSLDVSIQAQVINLLQDLQDRLGLTYLFIAHDLSLVKHISSRVAVMYLGKIVEVADKEDLYENPKHPYTQALLAAIPQPNQGLNHKRSVLSGEIPSPINPPAGCRFHTRCPYAQEVCRQVEPELKDLGENHLVACHLV